MRLWAVASLGLCFAELLLSSVIHLVYGLYIFSSAVAFDIVEILNNHHLKKLKIWETVAESYSKPNIVDSEGSRDIGNGPYFEGYEVAPIVLVHGIFGFGKGKLGGMSYWAGAEKKDDRVLVPDLGSLTSVYDRARDLFYYLKGGTVDYGEEHSAQYGHARFGKTYEQGYYPEWDENHPLHFVGHSAGVQVVRVLQQMLSEKKFQGYENSSESWVLSVTSLSGALNGTTRVYLDGMQPEDGKTIKPICLLQLCRVGVIIYDWLDIAWLKFWSRVQVRGQFSLLYGGTLSFGLSHYPFSEFELMAEELLMSDSMIKVYGALRMSVKMLLMWNSEMQIDGGGDAMVGTSLLEASNLVVLRENSSIYSNANLGVHGQGLLKLSGSGDTIKAQRLILSLFYNINVGPGSVLQAPLEDAAKGDLAPRLNCESPSCPEELIHPPEDCSVNTSLSFTLQICRVEDITVDGLIQGSVIHVHRARTVIVNPAGLITASRLGCKGGVGKGHVANAGAGGGGGHGGRGGDGYLNGVSSRGGEEYGIADLPCELGSGSGNSTSEGTTAGGGIIVMGSMEHSLSSLNIFGYVRVDGESNHQAGGNQSTENIGGSGGGSGGSLLLFLHSLTLGNNSLVSSAGGHGGHVGGGGGGGGRIHFDWSNIPTGDEYAPLANVKGTIYARGGMGSDGGHDGNDGTVTAKECPEGLYGIFCEECPIGTFKDTNGSDISLCQPCPPEELPHRGTYISVRGGVTQPSCPYVCLSERYHMPYCYTPLEELMYTFGGPWLFGLLLSGLLVLLALVLSVARMKFIGTDEFSGPVATQNESQIDHSFPFLESLNEVMESTRTEESENHVHRMYFMGPNTFGEPWQLPHSPPHRINSIVYEDAFNRFVDEINSLAAYQWWEGSVYSILAVLAYPFAWSWQQWRRRKKVQQLREFVRSEYDHACLRSCRSRALYEGLKVAATPDLMVAYVDFFLGGDEKRPDLPLRLQQRFPMSIIFGGDGSYMAPYSLHSDNLLTSLLGQSVPATMWYRFIAGLNAYLRTVHRGCRRITLLPVINWLGTHANPWLSLHGIRVDLAWFQATTSGYYQLGLIVNETNEVAQPTSLPNMGGTMTIEELRTNNTHSNHQTVQWQGGQQYTGWSRRRIGGIGGGIINLYTLPSLEDRKDFSFPFYLIVHNARPVGHEDLVGLIISILLLGDFSLVLLTLLQFYSISLAAFLLVLFVLPLALLSPFPAGINALFSHVPRRSAGLARVYALWNVTSLANVVTALIYGCYYYQIQSSSRGPENLHAWNFSTEESGWWLFPTGLLICKCIQARFVDRHIANLEVQDRTLYSNDPAKFWDS